MYKIKRPFDKLRVVPSKVEGRSHLYLTVLVITILESTVLNRIRLLNIQPDLLLVSVVFFSLYFNRQKALEAGIIGGILRDFVSSGFFGMNMILFGTAAYLVSLFSNKIYKDFFLNQILLVIITGTSLYLGYLCLRFIIGNAVVLELRASFVQVVIPAVLYTSLISPLAFFMLGRVFRSRE